MDVGAVKQKIVELGNTNIRLQNQIKQNELDMAYLQGVLELHTVQGKMAIKQLPEID